MTTTNDRLVHALQAMTDALQALIADKAPEREHGPHQVERPTLALESAEAPTISDPLRARRKWTQQEHDDLIVLCRYLSDREVAALLGRTAKAIEDRRLNATNVRRIAS